MKKASTRACPKNPKRFFWINYLGSHVPEPKYLRQFGAYSWATWEVTMECKNCGSRLGSEVFDEVEVIGMGASAEKLRNHDSGVLNLSRDFREFCESPTPPEAKP